MLELRCRRLHGVDRDAILRELQPWNVPVKYWCNRVFLMRNGNVSTDVSIFRLHQLCDGNISSEQRRLRMHELCCGGSRIGGIDRMFDLPCGNVCATFRFIELLELREGCVFYGEQFDVLRGLLRRDLSAHSKLCCLRVLSLRIWVRPGRVV